MRIWHKKLPVSGVIATLALGVCMAQTLPPQMTPAPVPTPSDPHAAVVVSLTGDVSVLKDSYPWALKVGDTVGTQQVVITGADGYAVFEVSDGSRFEVFPDSRVTFRNNPGDWKDLLDLWLGRVKVYIQKLGGQPNPHRIFTPTAVISVRGTVFDVAIEDDEDTTLVIVDEGAVSVSHRLIGESKDQVVSAGEYIRVYKNAPLAKKGIDKPDLARRIFRAATEAVYTIMVQNRRAGSTGGGGGTTSGGSGGPTLPGDTGGGSEPEGGSSPPTNPSPPSGPPPPPGG